MALLLEDDERQKVEQGRRKERPTYFDADLKLDVTITEDFEAVLILISGSAKQEAQTRLNEQQFSEESQKINEILQSALQIDSEIANNIVEEVQQDSEQYSSFREQFNDPKFQQVAEVGKLIRDTSLNDDLKILAGQRAFHRGVVATIVNDRIEKGGISPELEEERRSWVRVLSTYST